MKSQQFSGGDAVHVKIKEKLDPEVYEALEQEFFKYEYTGTLTRENVYISNRRTDIPQAKYVCMDYECVEWR